MAQRSASPSSSPAANSPSPLPSRRAAPTSTPDCPLLAVVRAAHAVLAGSTGAHVGEVRVEEVATAVVALRPQTHGDRVPYRGRDRVHRLHLVGEAAGTVRVHRPIRAAGQGARHPPDEVDVADVTVMIDDAALAVIVMVRMVADEAAGAGREMGGAIAETKIRKEGHGRGAFQTSSVLTRMSDWRYHSFNTHRKTGLMGAKHQPTVSRRETISGQYWELVKCKARLQGSQFSEAEQVRWPGYAEDRLCVPLQDCEGDQDC